ncbi:hypothetical protein NE237_020680 [Protea cynaroides]|uniref:Uncharacterized protein n=1 Tax=Protea cynaroides TaxID=273540 RepID=A0A9Q0K3N5_9MAGN|nr:hypothetical protein NE237_020680 [Protea cynaroides]
MVELPFMVAPSEGRFINESEGGVPNGSWNNNDRSQSGFRDSGASVFRGGRVQPGNPFMGNGGNLDQGLMPQNHQVGMAMGSSTQAAMSMVMAMASSSGNNDPGRRSASFLSQRGNQEGQMLSARFGQSNSIQTEFDRSFADCRQRDGMDQRLPALYGDSCHFCVDSKL